MRALPETFSATLVSAQALSPRVRSLTFERTDGKPFRCQSGQWVSAVLPVVDAKGKAVRRSYSIASAEHGRPQFELAVTHVPGGVGSSWLHQMPVGTALEMKGPQGSFLFEPHGGPSLMVATGTGIAPFRGMVADALRAQVTAPIWVLFGVRSLDDALYRDEFERLSAQHTNVRLLLSLSRPSADGSFKTGYVQQHVLSLWEELKGHGTPHAYVCGVSKMLLEVRDLLKSQGGAERQQLHLERYD
jgi:ferredoxin-NADP reductase